MSQFHGHPFFRSGALFIANKETPGGPKTMGLRMKKQRKYKKINLGSLPNQPESSYVMSSFRWVFLLKPNRYGWEASFPAGTLDPKLKKS